MDCPECARFEAERDGCERAFAVAVAVMNAAAGTSDKGEYIRLREAAQVVGLDLALAEARLKQHQNSHKLAN